jgi:predicted nuclease of restriction endonuclease-like (RecB) superfamily
MNSANSILINELKNLIKKARYNAVYAINKEMILAYYEIGKRIVEEEQKGKKRAEYGKNLLEIISNELTKEFGKGFNSSNLRRIRQFFLVYKNCATLSHKLSWSHYVELIKIEDENKREYFENYAITENLSVRDLKRQIYSLHYERLLLSKDKKYVITQDNKNNLPSIPEEVIKDPYVLEFLNLEESSKYNETNLEQNIIDYLQKFLLELGQGFSFVARQKRFTIDNENYYIDLLFYNIYLKSYVVIELKTGKFKHEFAGQLNFYLNFVKKELNKEGDNEPIGIILCTDKSNVQVEYATVGMSNKLFISKYQLYLPKKKELEKQLEKAIQSSKEEVGVSDSFEFSIKRGRMK